MALREKAHEWHRWVQISFVAYHVILSANHDKQVKQREDYTCLSRWAAPHAYTQQKLVIISNSVFFQAGDVITELESVDDDWMSGELMGKSGIFPKNYVQVLQVS